MTSLESISQSEPQIHIVTFTKEEIEAYEEPLKRLRENSFQKGKEEGIGIGEEKKAVAVAQSMLQKNMDTSLIMELTGLTGDAIKALGKT